MDHILTSKKIFLSYKELGEKAMAQVDDSVLNWQANEDSNSIANIVKHLWGNMLSRFTDFLTTDGEKPWRKRDEEFEPAGMTRAQMMALWEDGWQCVFGTLDSLTAADLDKTVYIRNEAHFAADAISRQIAHYSYHVGQIVYIAKLQSTGGWNSLSIPRGKTAEFNAAVMAKGKQ